MIRQVKIHLSNCDACQGASLGRIGQKFGYVCSKFYYHHIGFHVDMVDISVHYHALCILVWHIIHKKSKGK